MLAERGRTASGQSRHFDRGPATSDLPPGTDIVSSVGMSSNLPKTELAGNGATWRKASPESGYCVGVPGNGLSISGRQSTARGFQRLRVQVEALTAPTGASPLMIFATC
jgi:hypothetical protein